MCCSNASPIASCPRRRPAAPNEKTSGVHESPQMHASDSDDTFWSKSQSPPQHASIPPTTSKLPDKPESQRLTSRVHPVVKRSGDRHVETSISCPPRRRSCSRRFTGRYVDRSPTQRAESNCRAAAHSSGLHRLRPGRGVLAGHLRVGDDGGNERRHRQGQSVRKCRCRRSAFEPDTRIIFEETMKLGIRPIQRLGNDTRSGRTHIHATYPR